ncbi:hypothetical protein INT47_005751 [Mucor saturninus]|uniref:NADPH-dependent diflavin oxidoreductase 1 n=1 Tax=Mucor saturninus TaxID=64648 RepID=A0A8H7UZ52_9FUNG|nr:hypothetical protein INT47_005751 [Mucor saturninus]
MSRSLVILYGSETGCAQDVAETLGRQARHRHFKTKVMAMDDYDKNLLIEEELVIFVCSTTGQGSEPANMKKFWRFLLRKNLPHDILADLNCAVIGLGDSSYKKFNFPAKKLYKRLQQLGATLLVDRGDCDDQHYMGLDGEFIPWSKTLWDTVMLRFPTDKPAIPDDVLLPPSFHLEFLKESQQSTPPLTLPGEFNLTVRENKRITASDHFQDVRHVALSCENEEFGYEAGDIAVMMPQNLVRDVNVFLDAMGWSEHADEAIHISATNEDFTLPPHWPPTMTFRDLFVYHLDIFGVPRRSFFEMLAYFTTDENFTEKLREFASPQGQDDLWSYCMKPRRTVFEILFDFKPWVIPFHYILDLFPLLQPRSFSIASSLQVHPATMELCIAIVKYKTTLRSIRRGVFTKWLSGLEKGQVVPRVRITKGTMTLPPSQVPLIAIGPGTGVAPMRSFIEERIAAGAYDNLLIFGCRYAAKDYHYKEQWEDYVGKGQLTLWTACSRDDPDKKVYVQDKIREGGEVIWDWIDGEGAKVVLSGSSDKMPEDVAFALKSVFMKYGDLDPEEAETYFSNMIKTGQYQEECWA